METCSRQGARNEAVLGRLGEVHNLLPQLFHIRPALSIIFHFFIPGTRLSPDSWSLQSTISILSAPPHLSMAPDTTDLVLSQGSCCR